MSYLPDTAEQAVIRTKLERLDARDVELRRAACASGGPPPTADLDAISEERRKLRTEWRIIDEALCAVCQHARSSHTRGACARCSCPGFQESAEAKPMETARAFCDRVPRELGLVDFNSIEARRHLEKRLIERDAAVTQAAIERVAGSFAPLCRSCNRRTEPERWCYMVPFCFACLPPPPPIEMLVMP